MTNETTSSKATSTSARIYPDRWIEIPPNGRACEYTGLKHAKLYSLLGKGGIARGDVRVANLRNRGASHGKTIFHLGDMLEFLDRLAGKQGWTDRE